MKFNLREGIQRSIAASLCASLVFVNSAFAQSAVRVDSPTGGLGWLTRPYQARSVPPINLANTPRLESLIRAGNLYLTADDVVALAIENNIDVEVQRYGPLLAHEILKRAESGGVLRSVGLGVAAGPTSVSLTGVNVNASGSLGTSGNGVSSGGGILTQLGPALVSFDPTISAYAGFQHATSPENNTSLVGTNSFVQDSRTYQAQYTQNWASGTSAVFTFASQHAKVNSVFFALNPYEQGDIDLTVTQNLLQGLGPAVNGRNIRVQKNNVKVTDLQFKLQLITTISAVLNLYWDLVSFNQDLQARQQEVQTAQQAYDDNKKQVEIGTLADIEVTRAESQLYAAKQDLIISQTNLAQQETVLKNALSRAGVATADLADVHVVPLDKIVIPAQDETRPVDQLVSEALRQRVEIEESRINLNSNELNLVGIKNSLKPTLQAFAELTNNGLAGTPLAGVDLGSSPFIGGYGVFLGELFRRNYPNYSAGIALNIPLRNRAAQADYVTSVIELRQNQLSLQKNVNQVRVDVQNAVIGLTQARARYDAAVKARVLAGQTLDADQKKLSLGASTAFQVVQDQRDFATSQSSEAQSMANYSHARIAFQQAVGTTLDDNHVSMAEAIKGKVASMPVHTEVKP